MDDAERDAIKAQSAALNRWLIRFLGEEPEPAPPTARKPRKRSARQEKMDAHRRAVRLRVFGHE